LNLIYCSPNSSKKAYSSHLKLTLDNAEYNPLELSNAQIEVQYVDHIVRQLHRNKTPGMDSITAEHLLNAHPCVIVIITILLNIVLLHEHVPGCFCCSITFPIPKGKKTHWINLQNTEVSPSVHYLTIIWILSTRQIS